jgi:hypothetical protein
MSVLVRVDNLTYSVLGLQSPLRSVLLNDTAVSPTQTKFTIEVGPMQINLTYLNPIEVRTGVTRRRHIIYSRFRYSPRIGSSSQSHSHT